MRYLLFSICILFAISGFAQTGKLHITCIDEKTGQAVVACMDVFSDSTIIQSAYSDSTGTVLFSNLPAGMLSVRSSIANEEYNDENVFIQSGQVFQKTIFINAGKSNPLQDPQLTYELNSKGATMLDRKANADYMHLINGNLPSLSATIQEIQCVSVSSNRICLIDKSAGTTGSVITRYDFAKLPVRSVGEIVNIVGGVNSIEDKESIYIRGARSDANIYYLDGMRVTGLQNLPKSYIGEINVISGGIPANYGDVTGGVVVVSSAPIGKYGSSRYSPTPRPVKRTFNTSVNSAKNDDSLSITGTEYFPYDLDRFLPIYENDFLSSVIHPNSTFSIDVDRASWSYIKTRAINGLTISRDAVKLEEMINAFTYKKIEVPEEELMNVEIERSLCAWNEESELVTIHLKAMDLPKTITRKAHNFVFLIDVSGSMQWENKLELLKRGLINFVGTLNENDRVAIVTYAGASGVVLPPTLCVDKDQIIKSLSELESGGSTNGIGGIREAYSLAEKHYDPELNNRIILCTDGDFNVGISNTGDLEQFISQKRGKGIYLTALGFGMGNYRNDVLETLADRGDGNHFYINSLNECKKVLVDEIGNLLNIARDVKLNVEFNPKEVLEYRLIGYENRLLKPRDFEDDTKDAGEIGYGHKVTAVYEIKRGTSSKEKTHFTKTTIHGDRDELAFVKLRYKSFEDSASVERKYTLFTDEEMKDNQLINLVASFGLILRDSIFSGTLTEEKLKEMAKNYTPKSEEEVELKRIILGM